MQGCFTAFISCRGNGEPRLLEERDRTMKNPEPPEEEPDESTEAYEDLPFAEEVEMPTSKGVDYKRLYRWGWIVITWAPFLIIASQVVALLYQLAAQFNVTVLQGTLATLQGLKVDETAQRFLGSNPTKMSAAMTLLWFGAAIIVLSIINKFIAVYTDFVLIKKLQQMLHDKILKLGPEYHQEHQQGELNTIINNFSTGSAPMLVQIYAMPVVQIVVLFNAILLILQNLNTLQAIPGFLKIILVFCLLTFPLIGILLARRIGEAYTEVREKNIDLNNELMNSTNSPLEIQVMSAGEQRSKAFGERLNDYMRVQIAAAVRSQVSEQFESSMELVLSLIFIFSAVFFSAKGGDSVSPIVGFILLIPFVVGPLQQIVSFFVGIERVWPLIDEVINVLEIEPEVMESPDAQKLELQKSPAIYFENVNFTYTADGPPILDALTHSFDAGRVTAIVARSGMGKSSLLNLICRLRDPDGGTITIDGMDLKNLTLDSLRRKAARASQFPLWIVATIRANLQLAKADASDAELEALCRKTGMWGILLKVSPDAPLDFVLPRLEGLSGGERRLLSVTRALLYDPFVLLLDEPTTGVDAISRHSLIDNLREMCKGKTVLLVDHDMNFIKDWADQVVVLDRGKFIEIGSPHELLKNDGSLYRQLWEDYNRQEEENPDSREDQSREDQSPQGPLGSPPQTPLAPGEDK
jgi:ABC-type multidrug transport system fused ATPase/permease subunit